MDLDGSAEQLGDMVIELLRRLLQRFGVPAVLAFHTPGFGHLPATLRLSERHCDRSLSDERLREAQGGGGEANAQQCLFAARLHATQAAGPGAAPEGVAIDVAVAFDRDDAPAEPCCFDWAIVLQRAIAPQHEAPRAGDGLDGDHSVRDWAAPGVAEDHVTDGDQIRRDGRDGQDVAVLDGRRHAAARGAEAHMQPRIQQILYQRAKTAWNNPPH
jgi:hypothetical protein